MNASVSLMRAGTAQTLGALLGDSNPWRSYTIFGESIPHLLHWDWAYLWILSRKSPRPEEWDSRIEVWRRLLCMLLLGELQFERSAIAQPLLNYTGPVNLREVVFARAEKYFGDKPIGVLSPTVLIRPLPEPNRLNLTATMLEAGLPKHYDPPPNREDRRS